MLSTFKEHADKVARIFKLLQNRGCVVQSSDTAIHIMVPVGALGIKAWGYMDFLKAIGGTAFTYAMNSNIRAQVDAPRTKSRKVADIKAEKLAKKNELHQLKPWKYAAVK